MYPAPAEAYTCPADAYAYQQPVLLQSNQSYAASSVSQPIAQGVSASAIYPPPFDATQQMSAAPSGKQKKKKKKEKKEKKEKKHSKYSDQQFPQQLLQQGPAALIAPDVKGDALSNWAALKHALLFATAWKPRPSDPVQLANMKQEAKARGKVLKTVTFFRHGESQSNEAFDVYGKDTFLWHPGLTSRGEAQARVARETLMRSNPTIQLIVVSPLKRAIQTALIIFNHHISTLGVPVVAHPLATEQVTGSDDIGDSPSNLRAQWPYIDWSLMPAEEVWWWYPGPKNPYETVEEQQCKYKHKQWEEPWENVVRRAKELEHWLGARPETEIALVAHGDLLEAMTGRDLNNAESCMLEVDHVATSAPYPMATSSSSMMGAYSQQPQLQQQSMQGQGYPLGTMPPMVAQGQWH